MSQIETNDPRVLIAVAVAHLDDEDATATREPRDDSAWDAIVALQRIGSREVLDLCAGCSVSPDPRERRVAAAVLGQLGVAHRQASTAFREERSQALHALLLAEVAGPGRPPVLADVCAALGHLHDPRVIPVVAELRGHPDPDVRYAVVHGLTGHDDDAAVSGLIALSADPEAQVRNWATFGLGQQIERDTPALRNALSARLNDPDHDTRWEAVAGLARRETAFVERRFDMSLDAETRASFLRPVQIGDDLWRCEYRLRLSGVDLRFRAYGLDEVKALLLAIELAHRNLVVEAAYRRSTDTVREEAGVVSWAGSEALGPLLPIAVGADELQVNLFSGSGDADCRLDHVVLAEVGPRFSKVARVVDGALSAVGHKCRSAHLNGEMGDDEPDHYLEALLARIANLVVIGILEVRGAISQPRYSEVRLSDAGQGSGMASPEPGKSDAQDA